MGNTRLTFSVYNHRYSFHSVYGHTADCLVSASRKRAFEFCFKNYVICFVVDDEEDEEPDEETVMIVS